MTISIGGIKALAERPAPFDLPILRPSPEDIATLSRLWAEAVIAATPQTAPGTGPRRQGQLNRTTIEFIRDGATTGDRHRLLFSAAADLAELGADYALAYALLEESAATPAPPKEVRRQIECGIAHTKGKAQ